MHTQTSYHIDSVRRRATSYFPNDYDQPTKYRPALNVKKLIKSLRKAVCKGEDSSVPTPSSSRKRSASGSPLSAEGSTKRRRTSPESLDSEASNDDDDVNVDETGDNKDDANDSDDSDWCPDDWEDGWGKYPYVLVYPLVEDSFKEEEDLMRSSDDDLSLVPVFRHISELQYTKAIPDGKAKDYVDDHIAQKRGWDQEESELVDLLQQIRGDSMEPTIIDLGRLWLCRFHNRYVALSSEFANPYTTHGEEAQYESNKWFLLIPSIPWPDEIDFDAEDYAPSNAHEDMLEAFSILGDMGRATIKTHLRLVALPSCAYDSSQNELPFRLQVETTASFVVPTIFKPIRGNSKRDTAEREDIQRRILSFLFPPSVSNVPNVPAISETGSTDIPFFYSILTSAPSLRASLAEQTLQPEDLLPTLLPFQRRSVGWMLEREGKVVDSEGAIVPSSSISDPNNPSLPLFWDKIEIPGGDVWYIHRLTGILSPETPIEECPSGGILAEEPGLGKTLECIALIMLNPAPERNPTISYWDDKAQITLKEIKVFISLALVVRWRY
jgi:E3 ubiquitin-protein ligase SHPRH